MISSRGVTTIEVAGISFVLAVTAYLVFLIAEVVTLRYQVNEIIDSALSIKTIPLLALRAEAGLGRVVYEVKETEAVGFVENAAKQAEQRMATDIFVSNRPYALSAALYNVHIDEEYGSYEGVSAAVYSSHRGGYRPSEAVLKNHSTEQVLLQMQSHATVPAIFSEPSSAENQGSRSHKYLPRSLMMIMCIYVQDQTITKTPLISGALPEGVVAQCKSRKVRGFL